MSDYPSFVAAFFAMQQELPEIKKESVAEIPNRAPTYYANLKTVSDAIRPVLVKFGFIWITRPTLEDGKPVLAWELTHVSHTPDNPQQRTGLYPIFGDNKPQALGAATTYARRYAVCAVVGLTPDNEQDAEGKAPGRTVSRKPKTAPAEAPDPDTVPAAPLPGEPVNMMTQPQQRAIFALLKKLEVSDVDRGQVVNGVLTAAGIPNVTSFKELTIVTAGHVLTGLQKELDLRTGGAEEPT